MNLEKRINQEFERQKRDRLQARGRYDGYMRQHSILPVREKSRHIHMQIQITLASIDTHDHLCNLESMIQASERASAESDYRSWVCEHWKPYYTMKAIYQSIQYQVALDNLPQR